MMVYAVVRLGLYGPPKSKATASIDLQLGFTINSGFMDNREVSPLGKLSVL